MVVLVAVPHFDCMVKTGRENPVLEEHISLQSTYSVVMSLESKLVRQNQLLIKIEAGDLAMLGEVLGTRNLRVGASHVFRLRLVLGLSWPIRVVLIFIEFLRRNLVAAACINHCIVWILRFDVTSLLYSQKGVFVVASFLSG